MANDPQFKRILLKLSGEALMGDLSAKTGENVVIRRFARFAVGE